MKPELDQLLEESLQALRSGASIDDCLKRFPEHAEDLRPLLEMAAALSTVEQPHPAAAAIRRSRERMLQEAEHQFAKQPVSIGNFFRYAGRLFTWITGKENQDVKTTTRFALTILMLGVFVLSGLGVSLVSANALPGDTLYPAKRLAEQVRLSLTIDAEEKQALKSELQERRREEIRSVMEMGREVEVEFTGELTSFDASVWTVGGFNLNISADTRIEGTPYPGAIVNVTAVIRRDGSLEAEVLVVLPPEEGAPYATPANGMDYAPTMPPHDKNTPYPMPGNGTDYAPTMPPHDKNTPYPMPGSGTEHAPTMPAHSHASPTVMPTQPYVSPTVPPTGVPTQPPHPTHTHVPPTVSPTPVPPMPSPTVPPTGVPTQPHHPTHTHVPPTPCGTWMP